MSGSPLISFLKGRLKNITAGETLKRDLKGRVEGLMFFQEGATVNTWQQLRLLRR
jgi:hypothetical protein